MAIELTEEQIIEEGTEVKNGSSSSLKLISFFIKYVVGGSCLIALIVMGSFHVTHYYEIARNKVTEEFTIRRRQLANFISGTKEMHGMVIPASRDKYSQEELNALVSKYSAKHGVSPLVTWAIIDKESEGYMERVRYEESWKKQYAKAWKREPWMLNEEEYNLLFSSFGLMQVGYGLHKEFCELNSVVELFDPEVNLDCGLKKISACLDSRQNVKSIKERFRLCFRDYNGSGPRAEAYAQDVMQRLQDSIFEIDAHKLFKGTTVPTQIALQR